jgi:hypothetical protein
VTAIAYLDASALVKLLVSEADSAALARWYADTDRALTSRIGIVETRRAIARRDTRVDPALLEAALATLDVVELDAAIGARAGSLEPALLRTLDAIHVATALEIGPIDAFVTYDDRLAAAARDHGLPVVRPA